jgi:hypothetical protein
MKKDSVEAGFFIIFIFARFLSRLVFVEYINKLFRNITSQVPLQNGYSYIKDISLHRAKSPLTRMQYGTLLCNY